jgi:phosphoheptose isomerase
VTDPHADPRFRNRVFDVDAVTTYLDAYADSLQRALRAVDRDALTSAYALLEQTLAGGGKVLVAGNGGSAAVTDHLACDWMKGTRADGQPTLRVHSLVANSALTTALANDYGYEQIFAAQIEMLGQPGDLCVLISSSGNSANIALAAERARAMDIRVLGLTGFSGGRLAALSHVHLHVPVENYGLAEDSHQAIMHCLAQFLASRQDMRSNA